MHPSIQERLPGQTLLTDFYELTMAYGYWKSGRMQTPAVFTLYFRTNPFHGGYSVAAGLESAVEWLENFHFSEKDLQFLSEMKAPNGELFFEKDFLEILRTSRFECDVDAVPEGSVVFPNEPILKVRGPVWQCQWVEAALLNIINFQSLIATKASRIVFAARGGKVVDFGLRRAQGFDGALSATRAAYIGGISGTSNILASQIYGIPAVGTHAHSWIMFFDSEKESFERYAEAFPDQCTLLVDTYDTLSGVDNAIAIGKRLASRNKKLVGIRLDSGDFAYLSEEARKRLDASGLTSVEIVASNELDEYLIQSLKIQNAKIDVWGVGTKLITAQDQPSMTGVYKLSAVFEEKWKYKIKLSNQPAKTSNPGLHRIRRFRNEEGMLEGDLIYDETEAGKPIDKMVDPVVPVRTKKIQPRWKEEELMVPVFSKGKKVGTPPSLDDIRKKVQTELSTLHPGIRRFENPHEYPVGLSPFLAKLKADLIAQRAATE